MRVAEVEVGEAAVAVAVEGVPLAVDRPHQRMHPRTHDGPQLTSRSGGGQNPGSSSGGSGSGSGVGTSVAAGAAGGAAGGLAGGMLGSALASDHGHDTNNYYYGDGNSGAKGGGNETAGLAGADGQTSLGTPTVLGCESFILWMLLFWWLWERN